MHAPGPPPSRDLRPPAPEPGAPPGGPLRGRPGPDRRLPAARVLGVVAVALVAIGVAAQVQRPLAPELGAVPDPNALFDPAFLARVERYRAPLRLVALTRLALAVAVPLALAVTPPGRRLVGRLVGWTGAGHPVRAAALVALAVVVLTDLVALPLSFWAGFVHEGAWGFRTQGLAGWARDWLVLRVPGWAAAAALVAGAVVLTRRAGPAWTGLAALAGAGLVALVVFVAPVVLEPLAFRLRPLPDGPTRTEVERVLDRAGQPVDAILVADASRRTTKENAYVSGLGATRRVVLYDTLVASRPPEQVGAVLAHELGHDRNGDLGRGVLLGAAGSVVVSYAVAAFLRRRASRTGEEGLDPRAVPAVLALVAALTLASLPVQTWVSRRAEAAADWAALQITDDPATFVAMQEGFAVANLADPDPPWWARALWGTHPPPPARIAMAERYAADRP